MLNSLLQEEESLADEIWDKASSSSIEKEEVLKGHKGLHCLAEDYR